MRAEHQSPPPPECAQYLDVSLRAENVGVLPPWTAGGEAEPELEERSEDPLIYDPAALPGHSGQ